MRKINLADKAWYFLIPTSGVLIGLAAHFGKSHQSIFTSSMAGIVSIIFGILLYGYACYLENDY